MQERARSSSSYYNQEKQDAAYKYPMHYEQPAGALKANSPCKSIVSRPT
jgi:hypothetical protein